jgi:hypothetical protein
VSLFGTVVDIWTRVAQRALDLMTRPEVLYPVPDVAQE